MFVPPVEQSGFEALGPHRKNVTVPVGSAALVPPDTVNVAVSWTAVPGRTVPLLDAWVVMLAWHCAKFPSTKSFSVAVVEVDDRVSAAKLEKHSPASPIVERLMPAS